MSKRFSKHNDVPNHHPIVHWVTEWVSLGLTTWPADAKLQRKKSLKAPNLFVLLLCSFLVSTQKRRGSREGVCVVAYLPVKYGPNLSIVRPVYSITMCYYNVITQLHCYYSFPSAVTDQSMLTLWLHMVKICGEHIAKFDLAICFKRMGLKVCFILHLHINTVNKC